MDIDGPVPDTAVRLGSGQAKAWPVQCKDAEAAATGYLIDRVGFKARLGIAMEIEKRFAVGATVFGVTEGAAIREENV